MAKQNGTLVACTYVPLAWNGDGFGAECHGGVCHPYPLPHPAAWLCFVYCHNSEVVSAGESMNACNESDRSLPFRCTRLALPDRNLAYDRSQKNQPVKTLL